MRTGAAWADVPSRYPSSSTCYRYFQAWVKAGAFVKILNTLANARVARSTWQYRRYVVPQSGNALVTFNLTNDLLWPRGRYKVEIFLNDASDPARTLNFEVR